MPRHRRVPRYVEIGEQEPFYSSTPKEFYRRYFYDLDQISSAISHQFDKADYQTYKKTDNYGDEFKSFQLKTKLNILGTHFEQSKNESAFKLQNNGSVMSKLSIALWIFYNRIN